MDLDDVDRAFVASLVPEEAIATGLVALITWIDPETGEPRWRCYCDADMPVTSAIGALELAKLDVIARSNTGLPIKYEER